MESETPERGRRSNRGRLLTYVFAAIVAVIIVIYLSYIFLTWSIFQHMYEIKFGQFNWFSVVFYHYYAFVVPGIVALAVIYPYPRRSDFFALFRTFTTFSKTRGSYYEDVGTRNVTGVVPPEIQTASTGIWALWQIFKWAAAYIVAYYAQGFLFYPNVTQAAILDIYHVGSWALVPRIFMLPVFPASGQEIISLIPTMQAQYYIVISAIGILLTIISVRFFLRLVTDVLSRTGNKWILDILGIFLAILIAIWLGAPYWLMNVTTPYLYFALIIFILGTLFGFAYFRLSGKGLVPITARRRALTKTIAIVLGLILIINLGALAYFGVNWNNNWLSYQWTPQTQKQISVTSWSAGLDNVTTSPISDIPTGNISQIPGARPSVGSELFAD